MKRGLLYLSVALATLLVGVALHLALRGTRTEFAGAHPDTPGYEEPRFYHEPRRPLVRAAWAGNAEVVALLLDHGADIEQEGNREIIDLVRRAAE